MPPYEMPHYGGGAMMHGRGGHPPNWAPGPNMGPPQEGGFGGPGQTMYAFLLEVSLVYLFVSHKCLNAEM